MSNLVQRDHLAQRSAKTEPLEQTRCQLWLHRNRCRQSFMLAEGPW